MKYNELKNKKQADLESQDKELRGEIFALKIKNKTSQLENKARIRELRRDVARVQTKLSELNKGKTV